MTFSFHARFVRIKVRGLRVDFGGGWPDDSRIFYRKNARKRHNRMLELNFVHIYIYF